MTRSAPRISPRLLDAIDRLDDKRLPIAEIARRVARRADELGLPRPSYQRMRVLVHEARAQRRRPTTADVVLDTWLRARPAGDLLRHLDGEDVRPLGR